MGIIYLSIDIINKHVETNVSPVSVVTKTQNADTIVLKMKIHIIEFIRRIQPLCHKMWNIWILAQ